MNSIEEQVCETYQLIQTIEEELDGIMSAIAMNQQSTIVVVVGQNNIYIYDFNGTEMSKKQVIKVSDSPTQTITFIGKSNSFITGDSKGDIKFWDLDESLKEYKENFRIKTKFSIEQLIINKEENLIVYTNSQKEIIFTEKHLEWIQIQSLKKYGWCSSICFNDSQTQLLSVHTNYILINQRCNDNIWRKFQIIQFNGAMGGCFIKNNAIIYTLYRTDKAQFLKLSKQTSLFENHSSIQFQQFQQNQLISVFNFLYFNKEKSYLLASNSQYIEIIQVKENLQCQSLQSLYFDCDYFKAAMSEDGVFLIKIAYYSEIEVRKLKQ